LIIDNWFGGVLKGIGHLTGYSERRTRMKVRQSFHCMTNNERQIKKALLNASPMSEMVGFIQRRSADC
jgi:hypothetical protein